MWTYLRQLRGPCELSIVIAGLAKTGTTALFHKLKSAMPKNAICLFEPVELESKHLAKRRPLLAKIIFPQADAHSFRRFRKKILIVRDPRDRMVSSLLYRVYHYPAFCSDAAKVAAYLRMIQKKEASPGSVPLLDLIELGNKLIGGALTPFVVRERALVDFHRANPQYLLFRYDDLIRGQFSSLQPLLGFPLSNESADVPPQVERVIRTKGSGDWRHWFTAEDVAHFRPQLEPVLEHFGHERDWTLASEPRITAEHASEYVMRLVGERVARDQKHRELAGEQV